ncbi:F-box/WD-40 repeat-containing protein At5g21040 [Linum perenne]
MEIESKQIFISRDIIFYETILPYKTDHVPSNDLQHIAPHSDHNLKSDNASPNLNPQNTSPSQTDAPQNTSPSQTDAPNPSSTLSGSSCHLQDAGTDDEEEREIEVMEDDQGGVSPSPEPMQNLRSLHSRHSGDAVVGLNPGAVHTRIHRLRRGPNASRNTLVAVGIEPLFVRIRLVLNLLVIDVCVCGFRVCCILFSARFWNFILGVIEATGNQVSVDNSVLEVRDCAVSQQKIDFSSRREIISSVLVKELPGGDDDVLRRSITDLPPALISEILNCLDPKELGVVSCVSTVLNRLAADNPVWKEVYCERWGHPLTPSLAGVGISDDKSWKELFVEREFRSRTFLGRYSIDVLYGHKEAVRTVFLLASAKLIFTSGYDSVVQMWDMETGLKIASSRPLGCTIRAVAADTKLLVAGGTDGFIQGWKAVDGYPHLFDIKGLEEPAAMFRLWEHVGPITSLALDPMRIYSGSWDMAVRIWDRSSLTCVKVLSHGDWVWSIVPHGTTVASSSGSDVYIWDTLRGTLLNVIAQAHIGNVYALARSHTGEFLFTGGEDGSIHMFEISDNDTLKIASWIAHSGPVYSLAFEFPWLVSSSGDGKMALIDVRKLLRSAKCAPVKCSSKVRKMENKLVEPPQRMLHGFGPDLFAVDIGADRIVCGGEEGVVRIWNFSEALETERRVRALRGVRIENRMRRRKLQSEMGNKSGRSGQCSVAANKNSMKADREVVWHSKRGVSGKLKA